MMHTQGRRPTMPRLEVMQRLLSASKVGNQTTVKIIVDDHRGNPYTREYFNEALILASCFGHVEIVRLLLRARAEVSHSDARGMRAIHHVATCGSVETTKLLINAGSPLNGVDNGGMTPLHHAIESGHAAEVALLVKEGAAVCRPKNYTNGEAPIHSAAKRGRSDFMSSLLQKASDVNVLTSNDGMSSLHLAVKGRHFGVLTALCEAGAYVNQLNGNVESPLHTAVSNSSVKCVQILVEHGASPMQEDGHGRTPLHLVAASSLGPTSIEICAILLKHGPKELVNETDYDGCVALHFAASTGNVDVARLLIEEGSPLDAPGRGGDRPLHLAVNYGRDEMTLLLLQSGADATQVNSSGLTPLHQVPASRISDKMGVTDSLLRHGAKVNVRCQRGSSPLDRCVFTNVLGKRYCRETLYRIVGAGALLEKNPQSGGSQLRSSGLCWLTWHGELTTANFLVNSGWDTRNEPWVNLQGKTPEIDEFLVWLRELNRDPRPLKVICRSSIRNHLRALGQDTDIVPGIEQLPIPNLLKRFLTLDTEIKPSSPEYVASQNAPLCL